MHGVATREGHADFRGYRTWYRVTGELGGIKLPLVVLHGGPGCTHDYVDSFAKLGGPDRAVIHYDQLGNGGSTHLRDKGADFWTVDLFLDELQNLLGHLDRLRSLVIANSPPSMELWVKEANRLRRELPPEVQATLLRHEQAATTKSEEYQAAVRVFYDRHVCRVNPWPLEVARTFDAIAADPTVYHTMNGPSEFHVIGTLKSWSIIDRLDRINVPSLLISGRYDEATPAVVQPFADGIRNVRWEIFENSSHMPHVEETARCLQVVGDFLDAHD